MVVVGFLGAGKTSFLRRLAPALRGHGLRCDLVINDRENACLDALGFAGRVEQVVPLAGSCVCCDAGERLVALLRGTNPPEAGVVLVEANGTTDPPALLGRLASATGLGHLTYPVQVGVVDVKRWQRRERHDYLERLQVQTATHVFLGWTDAVAPERLEAVERSLAVHSPASRRVSAESLAAELVGLARAARTWRCRDEGLVAGPTRLQGTVEAASGELRSSGTDAHAVSHTFSSFQAVIPGAVDRTSFLRFMDRLPGQVMRAKGLVRLRERPGALWPFHKVDRETEIAPHPLAGGVGTDAVAVFIGVSLDAPWIVRGLATLTRSRR